MRRSVVAVAVTAGGLAALGLAFLYLRRRRGKSDANSSGGEETFRDQVALLAKSRAASANRELAGASAQDVVEWAVQQFGDRVALSTSFGMQSAVMLHMVTRVKPDMPIIWIDTGYLPPETYRFAQALQRRLKLNLVVVQSDMTPARMEALHGKLWESDGEAHRIYGIMRKVAPLQKAMKDLSAECLLSGVRGGQTSHRKGLETVLYVEEREHFKVHPLLSWSAEDVEAYIMEHKLPYHPLKKKGYVTVGDAHSSRPRVEGEDARSTRFGGKHQECGLHTENKSDAELARLVASLNTPGPPVCQDDDGVEYVVRIHGSDVGYEIYGRDNCRFCNASKELLRAKDHPVTWYTLQRFNPVAQQMEPTFCDGQTCVDRVSLTARIESVAPGEEYFSTVPQIFHNGEYIGGFTDLCQHLKTPEKLANLFLSLSKSEIEVKQTETWAGGVGDFHTSSSKGNVRRTPSMETQLKMQALFTPPESPPPPSS